ncbi:23S rRNA (adenine(2503)-C(2))-methyltransferase RlmN [Synechococcus elongatus IITB4]|uniref:23S rRNA (adenine(2503)-C(2))-methyltransferase RlmN n=1 Tax=Synechococcus elongatus TaxID=32046 RepID=UPI0030CD60C2
MARSGLELQAVADTTPLLGRSLPELQDWVVTQGQPSYRAKQLHQWLYERSVHNLAEVSVFPKDWRQSLQSVPVGRSRIAERSQSPSGTVKYLLQLDDGEIIEAVGIPSGDRLTVCVSSQVGCAMACDFCATGKGGFRRHLAPHEIIDQVLTVQEDWQQRVSNIVFMGMGEPLLNLDSVLSAIRCLNQDIGIGQRGITVSTVGIPGHIRRLAETGRVGDRPLQFTLAVSLHASSQAVRDQIIPSSRHYPITDLLQECRDYVQITGRRVTFEYILLAGLNDHPAQAEQLAKLLRGFQSHVNLIPYNPIDEVEYQRPSKARVDAFAEALRQQRIAVTVRWSKGLGADAACGQLRANRRPTSLTV